MTDLEILKDAFDRLGIKYHELIEGDYVYAAEVRGARHARAHQRHGQSLPVAKVRTAAQLFRIL